MVGTKERLLVVCCGFVLRVVLCIAVVRVVAVVEVNSLRVMICVCGGGGEVLELLLRRHCCVVQGGCVFGFLFP